MASRVLILVIGLGLAGCGSAQPTAAPTSPATFASLPPVAATIPEDLTFGGSVQGHAITALLPHTHAGADPRGGDHNGFTDWTQCADFSFDYNAGHIAHEWLAVVVVDVSGKRYALWLEVDKDQTKVSGSHETGLQNNAEIASLEQKNPRAEWTRETGSGTFTVSPDQKGGDVNLRLAAGHNDPNVVTVTGHWACP